MTKTYDTTFESLGVSKNIIQALKQKGYINPTQIQQKIIPLFLNGNDNIIGKAKTGTGKTASFGIPIIQNILSKNNNIQALILTPTRELAIQVSEELKTFGGINNLLTLCVFGGQSINIQIKQLMYNPDIVVGTPGRVIDLINRKKLDLSNISYFVLDEADEMLNMGFINDIESILKSTPKSKRMLFFSATMPKQITNIAKKYMNKYVYVSIDELKTDIKLTDQFAVEVPNNLKFECLCRIIDSVDEFYGIIFCGRKDTASNISTKLNYYGYRCSAIHGDILQEQRIKIMTLFKKHEINILIATDVASRGLDINNLTHVVNFDVPQDPESYIHRIGRTGRAGKKGIAITLFTNSETSRLRFIKKLTGAPINQMDLMTSKEISILKQNKLMIHINNLINEDVSNNNIIFKEFLNKFIEQYPNKMEDIVLSLLKDSYSTKILIQDRDSKIDELLLKNKVENKKNDRRNRIVNTRSRTKKYIKN